MPVILKLWNCVPKGPEWYGNADRKTDRETDDRDFEILNFLRKILENKAVNVMLSKQIIYWRCKKRN